MAARGVAQPAGEGLGHGEITATGQNTVFPNFILEMTELRVWAKSKKKKKTQQNMLETPAQLVTLWMLVF